MLLKNLADASGDKKICWANRPANSPLPCSGSLIPNVR